MGLLYHLVCFCGGGCKSVVGNGATEPTVVEHPLPIHNIDVVYKLDLTLMKMHMSLI